jgi:hypothetical protein
MDWSKKLKQNSKCRSLVNQMLEFLYDFHCACVACDTQGNLRLAANSQQEKCVPRGKEYVTV